MSTLQDRFFLLLEQHVHKLTIRGARATGLCPFHDEKTPSLSINIEKAIFYCFGCGISGGVKRFAELVGEPWATARLSSQERRQLGVSLRRREAEKKARTILQRREAERLDDIFDEWREVNRDAAFAAELLSLFHRRPDLEAEFSDLAVKTEHEYGDAVSRRVLLEARLDGEVG